MTPFQRYAPAIAAFHFGAAMVALSFGAVVLRGGSPVTPELYGPAVYAFPAMGWVTIQLTGALSAAIGSVVGGRNGAWVCVAGALITGLLFSAFALMATEAGAPGTLLAAGCAWVMAPGSYISAVLGIQHLRGRDGQ